MDQYLISIVTEQVVIGNNGSEDNTTVHVLITDTVAQEQVSVPLELIVQFSDFLHYSTQQEEEQQQQEDDEVEVVSHPVAPKRMVVKRSDVEE